MSKNIFDDFTPVIKRVGTKCAAFLTEIPEITTTAESSIDAITDLKIKWEEYKNNLKTKQLAMPVPLSKKDYSGQFNVRLDPALHRALVQEAARKEMSLNALIVKKLEDTTTRDITHIRWNLNEVKFWPETYSFVLFFKSTHKKELILRMNKIVLEDSLGDKNVASDATLLPYIQSNQTLLNAFDQFLSEHISIGKVNKNDIIECILVSKRDFNDKMHCSQNSLSDCVFHNEFYIYQVCP
jgi:predicted HicB family RNase H-like nuclease